MGVLKRKGYSVGLKIDGLTRISLSQENIDNLTSYLGNTTKKALAFNVIARKPGARTNEVRDFADCANVPDATADANKKLMNFGLMLICSKPPYKAYNSGYHFWYLVEAPIMQVPIGMASNDGRI